MASVWIEKLKSGRWKVQWRERDGSKPSQSYDTRGEAMRAKREQEIKLGPTLRGAWRKLGNRPTVYLTIEQIAERWRETREGTELAKRPGGDRYMLEVTREAGRIAKALGWVYSRDANAADVADLKRLRKNRGTARPLGYLRLVLRWAAQHQNQPLDVAADMALRAPQSRKAALELLTERQAKAVLARARRFDQLPLVSCLLVYGWRPITACRLRVGDVDLERGSIRLAVKQSGEPWRHPLFPFHVDQLRKIIGRRPPAAPLFLNPFGKAPKDGEPQDLVATAWTPAELIGFYRRHLRPARAQAGNTYALKRFAISRMEAGQWPWTDRLAIADIQLFTGHKTKEQVLRYLATSFDRARGLVGGRGAARGAGETPNRHSQPSAAAMGKAQAQSPPEDAK